MTDQREWLTEAVNRRERAWDEVDALCQGTRRWTMRVPAEEDRDSDCVIVAALEDHRRLIAALRAALDVTDELARDAETYAGNADRLKGVERSAASAYAIAYGSAADRICAALDGAR